MTFLRRIVCLACLAALFAGSSQNLFADDKDKKEPAPKAPEWVVTIEVLMVAMPQEKFIELLPDLQDEAKIEKVVPDLWTAVKKKEMILRGYPMVVTKSGQRAVSETIKETRYPTEFDPPTVPSGVGSPPPPPKTGSDYDQAWPSAFETRNAGVTLEAEPVVSTNGDWIELNLVPQDVELLEFDSFSAAKKKAGEPLKDSDPKFRMDQPKFYTMKTTTSLALRNGQYVLLATHKMARPEGYVDVFIVHAVAKMVK